MKRFDIVTLFPEMFSALTGSGITARAENRGIYDLVCWNPREFADDTRRTVDDRPYGGGAGMILMADPLVKAIDAAKKRQMSAGVRTSTTIYLSPQGQVLTQKLVEEISRLDGLVLMSGRYEGIDERVIELDIDREISLGDFVLSGGEPAAVALVDAVGRLVPGVLGHASSAAQDSFSDGLLDCPHYTRPEEIAGLRVPDVLLSGHHGDIAKWRRKQALGRTWLRRPEIVEKQELSDEDQLLLDEFIRESKP